MGRGKHSFRVHTPSASPPIDRLKKYLESFSNEHNVDLTPLLREADKLQPKEILVPTSIFSRRISSLEAITKYLHDHENLSLAEISRLLNRDYRSIWLTYQNASKKHPDPLLVAPSPTLPPTILADRSLSVLESIVSYLRSQDNSLRQISILLQRDERNIWTINNRAQRKCQNKK